MVSKAREDLPEPERPVITVKRSRGMSTFMFLRLCWRAPFTLMRSMAIAKTRHSNGRIFAPQAKRSSGARQSTDYTDCLGKICVICGSEVDASADFEATRRLRRGGLAEERRGLHAGKRAEVGVVQQVESLRVELHAVLLRGRARQRRRHRAVTAAHANHANLRSRV